MSSSDPNSASQHRRREWSRILTVSSFILLFGLLGGWLLQQESDLPLSSNILLFALINLNLILLLLLIYLLLRNIAKLVFDRKRNILGHRLRTRLVVAFVGLTLIPTIPLFWVATQFMFSSFDYWFSHRVEQSLEESVSLAKDYLAQVGEDLTSDCRLVAAELMRDIVAKGGISPDTESYVASQMEKLRLDAVFFYRKDGALLFKIKKSVLPVRAGRKIRQRVLPHVGIDPQVYSIVFDGKQEMLIAISELAASELPTAYEGAKLVLARILPPRIMDKLSSISSGYETYLQLKLLQSPFRTSHFITFSIVALLVIFAAIWFGFFLAKSITVPIQELVFATKRIAEGDLDIVLDSERSDEIGMLMASFNKMVQDLGDSRKQLACAYDALQQSHGELEDRRRYMEIVLRNIAAGVVSVDAAGTVTTMNKSAEAILGRRAEDAKGRLYSELLQPAHIEIVKSFIASFRATRHPYIEQHVQVMVGSRPMVLLIKVSLLRDEQDRYLGVVVVLDDLTELEKAQRMAAWREVARRIAHEIKNPLTPIQLSAQRMRRRYAELLCREGSILDECTDTIIRQVDHMKRLVNEFSKFARLPRARLAPSDLASIVEESLVLYRHDHPHINFSIEKRAELPLLKLDRDQFREVMVNLVENALHAMGTEEGSVIVRLFFDRELNMARLECADTGHGLSPDDKLRIFEPYYSTKEKGSGLGLAIVAGIIADHNGFIRVEDNTPTGTVIVIELPGYESVA